MPIICQLLTDQGITHARQALCLHHVAHRGLIARQAFHRVAEAAPPRAGHFMLHCSAATRGVTQSLKVRKKSIADNKPIRKYAGMGVSGHGNACVCAVTRAKACIPPFTVLVGLGSAWISLDQPLVRVTLHLHP